MSTESAPGARLPAGGLRHEPALDGLRGLAVAAVVAYHLGFAGATGGFLGVSLFFTLSGFLITNLLLAESEARGRVALGAFWGRRARRLLPAACAGVALAVLVAAVNADSYQLAHLTGDVVGALGYAANWRFVLDHSTYQAGYQAPSPLLHYWSLAIEEQLYLVLPLLVVAMTALGRGRRGRGRQQLGVAVVALLVASAVATFVVGGAADPNRVYFGTDTRMFELLAGVLLAAVIGFPARSSSGVVGADGAVGAVGAIGRRRGDRAVGAVGAVALAATLGLWAGVAEGDRWLYRGGLWLVAALSCGLIVAAVRGAGPLKLLRRGPLTTLGRVSYGVYIYHWPLFLLIDGHRTGLDGVALAGVRLAATAVVAGASYRWLELPIRQQRWRLPRPALVLAPAVPAALVAAAVMLGAEAPALAIAPVSAHPVVIQALASASSPLSSPLPGPPLSSPPTGPTLHRVLFMGDSLVQQAFPTFAARLRAAGVEARAIGGPGVSLMSNRGGELADLGRAVRATDPDVVVLESCCGLLGTDAPWVDAHGAAVARDSPALWAEWRRLAAAATATAASRGAVVLWVLGPPLHTNGWYGQVDGQVPVVNAIYRSVATCTDGAGIIDWGAAAGAGGRYAEALPDSSGRLVTVRMSDGFHFTPAGWDLLARVTLPAVARQWSADHGRLPIPPATRPGWCGAA